MCTCTNDGHKVGSKKWAVVGGKAVASVEKREEEREVYPQRILLGLFR